MSAGAGTKGFLSDLRKNEPTPSCYERLLGFSPQSGNQTQDRVVKVSCVLLCRTLLALGCHVGMGDEKAEENLKKIKLPKTYVKK